MKKILFLIKKAQPKHEPLFLSAAKQVGVELFIHQLDELVIDFTEKQAKCFFGSHEVKEFDLVFFRTVGEYVEQETLISNYCHIHNIPVIDSVFTHSQPWIDRKSFEYQTLMHNNLPVIPSYFISRKSFSLIAPHISYPCVVKVTNESKGLGVYKCISKQVILHIFSREKKPLIIQKYIENTGDIRVFIVGDQILGAIKRSSSTKTEFRNNISLGGTSELYELSEYEKELALNAAKALQYEIAGVDLIQNKAGETLIMEVNRAPQFTGFMKTTGIDVPEKIIEYLVSQS